MSFLPPPLRTTPLGCLVQVVTGASRYRCPVCGLVALLSAWCVVCALLLLFVLTVASKAVALCGVLYPLHHCVYVVGVLCISSLRYSSWMIQDPHWASVKARVHPLWFSCALSPPVLCCLLAPLSSFFVWVVPVFVFSFCPCCSAWFSCLGCLVSFRGSVSFMSVWVSRHVLPNAGRGSECVCRSVVLCRLLLSPVEFVCCVFGALPRSPPLSRG